MNISNTSSAPHRALFSPLRKEHDMSEHLYLIDPPTPFMPPPTNPEPDTPFMPPNPAGNPDLPYMPSPNDNPDLPAEPEPDPEMPDNRETDA